MRITLDTGTPAEIAQAPSGEPRAGLVLFPDIGGLRPLFDEHCGRLADDLDCTVVAIEPFPGQEGLSPEERLQAVGALDDGDKAADALAAGERIGAGRLWVMGFCMGGMYALKAAAQPVFSKAVSFYGMIRIPEQWRSNGQREPLELLADNGASHVLAIIGTEDPWVSVEDGKALEELGAEVVVYEGAEHGFVHDPDRPAHRPDDAADAWRRVYDFLRS